MRLPFNEVSRNRGDKERLSLASFQSEWPTGHSDEDDGEAAGCPILEAWGDPGGHEFGSCEQIALKHSLDVRRWPREAARTGRGLGLGSEVPQLSSVN